jgi:hypothetical protein
MYRTLNGEFFRLNCSNKNSKNCSGTYAKNVMSVYLIPVCFVTHNTKIVSNIDNAV